MTNVAFVGSSPTRALASAADEGGSNASSTDSLRARETCRDFLKGACFRDNCRYAHDAMEGSVVPAQTTQPVCRDYQNGRCFRASCRFYHGSSAEQMSAQAGAIEVTQMFNTAQALYGMGQIGAKVNTNPQLHFMNRTMNLQAPYDGSLGFDPLTFGQNLTLDQAVFLQAAVANGAVYDSNHMLTAAAMANEILRRSGAGQGSANVFDLSWVSTQQHMAAAAAAVAAVGGDSPPNVAAHMFNNGNTLQMQQQMQQQQHYSNVMNGEPSNLGYVPHQPVKIPNANAAPSQYSAWLSPPGFPVGGELHKMSSKSNDISALPDSLIDSDITMNIDLSSFHTEYSGFGNRTWS